MGWHSRSPIPVGLIVVGTVLAPAAVSSAQVPTPTPVPLITAVDQTLKHVTGDVRSLTEATTDLVLDPLPTATAAPPPPAATAAPTPSATRPARPTQVRQAKTLPSESAARLVAAATASPPRAAPEAPSATPRPQRSSSRARPAAARDTRSARRASVRPQNTPTGPSRPSRRLLRVFVDSIPGWMKIALIFLTALVALFARGILRSRRELTRALERAHHDVVTGLPNRAAVDEALTRMTAQAARNDSSLGVVMLDIDHFKSINDTYGHAKGDEVLATIGSIARTTVRTGDFVGRFGGEELLVLLPDTDQQGAWHVAEKLRLALREDRIAGLDQPITASCGVSGGTGDHEHLRALVQEADAAMYRAKANGRDRTEAVEAHDRVAVGACA